MSDNATRIIIGIGLAIVALLIAILIWGGQSSDAQFSGTRAESAPMVDPNAPMVPLSDQVEAFGIQVLPDASAAIRLAYNNDPESLTASVRAMTVAFCDKLDEFGPTRENVGYILTESYVAGLSDLFPTQGSYSRFMGASVPVFCTNAQVENILALL